MSFSKIILLIALSSTAQISLASWEVIPEKSALLEISKAPATATLPEILKVVSWNAHKGEDGNKWANDLRKLSEGANFVLLQEGMNDSFMPNVLKSISQMGWIMAQTFYMDTDHNSTGVITGSSQQPFSSIQSRSPDKEPISGTPKATLMTTYTLKSGSRLLVINTHGINFVSVSAFKRQIDDIINVIKGWTGKIIWAGDFNTWAPGRTEHLRDQAEKLGMTELSFMNDDRTLVLDRMFSRGCLAYNAYLHDEIDSSDHKPLTADFYCR